MKQREMSKIGNTEAAKKHTQFFYMPPRSESEQAWSWKFMGPKRLWRLLKDGCPDLSHQDTLAD